MVFTQYVNAELYLSSKIGMEALTRATIEHNLSPIYVFYLATDESNIWPIHIWLDDFFRPVCLRYHVCIDKMHKCMVAKSWDDLIAIVH
jgi:hypothetical protein